MKILSLLLLLALGLGAGWWTLTHPGGTLEDARGEVGALGERTAPALDRARASVIDALGLAVGGDRDAPPDVEPEAEQDVDTGTSAAGMPPEDETAPSPGETAADAASALDPAADDASVAEGLADVERRLEAALTRDDETRERLDTTDARLRALTERLDALEAPDRGEAMPVPDALDERSPAAESAAESAAEPAAPAEPAR